MLSVCFLYAYFIKRFSIDQKSKKKLNPKKVQKKLKLASDLFDFAFKIKCFQIKKKNPKLTEKEINKKAYELIERGCS